MVTKTISLEVDAYEKLRTAKKPGESFSEVVRRAVLVESPMTGGELRESLATGSICVSKKYLDTVEEATKHDPIPGDPSA